MTYHRSLRVLVRDWPIGGVAKILSDLKSRRCLCVRLNLVETYISPRSCVMASGDQNYVFHLYPQPTLLSEGKPRVDMLDNPFLEMAQNEGVLTS